MKARLPIQLSSSQRKAMNQEINRQILEHDEKFSKDFDSMVLWTLHVCFGFGKKRLKRFWDIFLSEHKRLREYYELDPGDDGWLYRYKLKDIGVDVESWYEESEHK